jgi:hypothetical protein
VYFQLVSLSLKLWAGREASKRLADYIAGNTSRGMLRGSWEVDIGVIGRLVALVEFGERDAMEAERAQIVASSDPMGVGDTIAGYELRAFEAFDFCAPLPPGRYGSVYEIRDYRLKPCGMTPTLEAWRAALPGRQEICPVAVAMQALDGPPAITHIVPYADLNARAALRVDLYKQGLWPPKGAPEQIEQATSTIALPMRESPWA